MTFVQARHYGEKEDRRIDLIVLHSMESSERPETAENVAAWFGGKDAPRASAHFCVDNNSVVQCVRVQDVAWHAPGANHNGIGIEHAGRAKQTREEWLDDYGLSMLELSARLSAHLCKELNIPPALMNAGMLRGGILEDGMRKPARGITRHVDVTAAFRKSTHVDPGEGFPLDWYIRRVAALLTESDSLSARGAIDVPL